MQEIKNKVEAVLFITGRLMSLDEIAQFCNLGSVGIVREALDALQQDYAKREGSLEIVEHEKQFKLGIKKGYTHLSAKLLSAAELDPPTQATLALIAYKQPALQAEIVKMRGNSAYDHIKALKELEFITSERKGRTRLLKLSAKFFDYFDIIENEMKEEFHTVGEKQAQLLKEKGEKEPAFDEPAAEEREEEHVPEPTAIVKEVAVIAEPSPQEALARLDPDDFGASTKYEV